MRNKRVKLFAAALLFMGSIVVGNKEVQAAQWEYNSSGWWYQEDDGSYPVNTWKSISGKWYYFDGNGYMLTGWQKINGVWYYLYSDGAMASNRWVGDYYLTENGAMATNTWIDGYYVGSDGQWKRNQWINTEYGWWYRHGDGSYTTNNWEFIDGYWYYFDGNGYMKTGWQEIWGKWYYLYSDGAMASNRWIGDYYLTESGAMATNTWIDGYYVGPDGKWVKDISTVYEMEVANIVNKERAANGLEPLEYDYELAEAAGVRAKELEQNLSHTRPDGTSCFTVLQEFGIEYWMCGENIAAGQRSAEQVMNGWMNSPGHRQNIMSPYTHIGVGYYVDKNGRTNWVQLFIGK